MIHFLTMAPLRTYTSSQWILNLANSFGQTRLRRKLVCTYNFHLQFPFRVPVQAHANGLIRNGPTHMHTSRTKSRFPPQTAVHKLAKIADQHRPRVWVELLRMGGVTKDGWSYSGLSFLRISQAMFVQTLYKQTLYKSRLINYSLNLYDPKYMNFL
jgi:hypothetical protein